MRFIAYKLNGVIEDGFKRGHDVYSFVRTDSTDLSAVAFAVYTEKSTYPWLKCINAAMNFIHVRNVCMSPVGFGILNTGDCNLHMFMYNSREDMTEDVEPDLRENIQLMWNVKGFAPFIIFDEADVYLLSMSLDVCAHISGL